MIVAIIKVTDSNNNYGIGEVTHGQFTHQPIIGLTKHFRDMLIGTDGDNINQIWEKLVLIYLCNNPIYFMLL